MVTVIFCFTVMDCVTALEDSTLSYAIWGNPHTVNTVLNLYTEILLVCTADTSTTVTPYELHR